MRARIYLKTNTSGLATPRTRVSSVVAPLPGNVQDAAAAAYREGGRNFAAVSEV